MPEHFLHRAQIPRGLQHVRREGVPQHVRMHVLRQAQAQRPLRERVAHRSRADPTAARAHEKSGFAGIRERAAPREPGFNGFARFAPTGTVRVFDPLPVTVTSA